MACNEIAADFVIERYVSGTLTEFETTAFEEHLLLCERCQGELLLAVAIQEGISEVAGAAVEEAEQEVESKRLGRRGENPAVPGDRARRWGARSGSRPRLAIAASVLICLGAATWWALGGGTKSEAHKLVVMPFGNLTADSTNDYMLAGLADGILSELKRLRAVTALSPATAQLVAGRGEPLSDIANELGDAYFLEASVSSVNDSLSLRLRLREGRDERIVWSQEYRAPADSAISLSMLPRDIVRALGEQGTIELTTAERRRLDRVRTVDPEAKRLYDEGLFLVRRGDPAGAERGLMLLEQAIRLDPGYAEAHSLLATAYITAIYALGMPTSEGYPEAMRAARAALALDETIADAHSALGWSQFMYDWDWTAGLRELKRGYELEPDNERASFFYSFVLSMMGQHQEAIRIAEKAAEVDPLSIPLVNHVGTVHSYARHYDEAILGYNRALLLQPDWHFAYQRLPLAYSELGMHEQAIAIARDGVATDPVYRGQLGLVLAKAGRTDEAAVIADQLRQEVERGEYPFVTVLAALYGALGDGDQAFDLLERAADVRDPSLQTIHESSEYDPLRSDARFKELQERLGLPKR